MNASFTIREILKKDFGAVRRLWQAAEMSSRASDENAELAKKLGRDPDLFLVAEVDSQIVGVVIGAWDGRRGGAYRMAVHPDHQKQGVGRALMLAIEERLRAKGALKINLLVEQDNVQAVGFYERLGYHDGQYVVMTKNL